MLDKVITYYQEKFSEFGKTSRGVDWPNEESQRLRFIQISKLIAADNNFSLADFGCGYGAYLSFLQENHKNFSYTGYDLAKNMLAEASSDFPETNSVKFINSGEIQTHYDYIVASGLFNVKLETDEKSWKEFILKKISMFNDYSTRGFAFNCLTKYSDASHMVNKLYYADPCEIFDYCKSRFSKNVALLHDYDLYEFTIIVRK